MLAALLMEDEAFFDSWVVCANCGQELPKSQFNHHPRKANGRHSWCVDCFKTYHRIREEAASMSRVCLVVWEGEVCGEPASGRSSKDTPLCQNHLAIRTKWGNPLVNQRLFAYQKGICPVCDLPVDLFGRQAHVDHDHACCGLHKGCTNCIRGLLHAGCNQWYVKWLETNPHKQTSSDKRYLAARPLQEG